MRIFVTGGTGLLGNTVARKLVDRDPPSTPVLLVRSSSDNAALAGLDNHTVFGDLLDRDVIFAAIKNCDAVVHSAGLIHLGWKRREESIRVNVDGTRNIIDACVKHDVPLVHVGTVNTLAVGTRRNVADEETPLDHAGGQVPSSYVVSKRAGVDEVVKAVADEGLRALIVHPGLMFGPWDWKPSSGRMIQAVSESWRPLSPSGGTTLCDSRDVADAILSAIDLMLTQQFTSGRQYILGGENWTYFELWKYIASQTAQRGPLMPLGPAQQAILCWAGAAYSWLVSSEPDVNSAAVRMSSQYHWYDSSRAKTELGYRFRNPQESIQNSIAWLQENGMLKPK